MRVYRAPKLTPFHADAYNLRLSKRRNTGGDTIMAYAIIRTGGKQFRVSPGDVIRIPTLADKNEGDTVEFDEVLVAGSDDGVRIGAPTLAGARVTATVLKNGRGPKIIVFKFKRRKHYKRTKGHRQGFTAVKIDSVA